jgi:uncharacterized protein (DUF58 family)
LIPREYIQKIRKIEIRTNRLARDMLAGAYHSAFKGRGMDFEEVRAYEPGDDVRAIDWNVTARTGITHIKKFREERELTMMLIVDVSASGMLGSMNQNKRELMAEVASLLAFSALRNSDRIGLILFSDEVESFIPPKKGRSHVFRLIREILFFAPGSKRTDIKVALDFANRVMVRPGVIFLISDFLCDGFSKTMRITNQKHDLLAILVRDPRENTLPNVGEITLEDSETGEILRIDTSDASLRQRFETRARERLQELRRQITLAGTGRIDLETGKPYYLSFKRFFEKRKAR